MARILKFGLAGPLIGLLVLLLILFPLTDLVSERLRTPPLLAPLMWTIAIPAAYVLGLGPALLTGWLDWWLERRRVRQRTLLCAAFGTVMSLVPLLLLSGASGLPWLALPMFALSGAVPALICSWWSGQAARQRGVTTSITAAASSDRH
jgi:hypothetical protein